MLADFFVEVEAEKLVVDLFLILSFNLVALDFVEGGRLLKAAAAIFLKSFFVLADLSIAVATERDQKS